MSAVTYDFAVAIPVDRLRELVDFCPAELVEFADIDDDRFVRRFREIDLSILEAGRLKTIIVTTPDQKFAAMFRLLWSDCATVLPSEEEAKASLTKRVAEAGLMMQHTAQQMAAGLLNSPQPHQYYNLAAAGMQAASYLQQLTHCQSLVSAAGATGYGRLGIASKGGAK